MFNRLVSAFSVKGCNCIIVKNTVKASQYDHELNQFIKKKLSQRFHIFSDGTTVQRDVYSAFLLYCTNKTLTTPDRNLCFTHFENFYKLYKEFEKYVEDNHIKILNYK